MKEATGELNMTVITVVAIAAVAAFFYVFLWPSIKANINRSTICASAYNCTNCSGGMCECDYVDEDDEVQTGYKCPDPAAAADEG